MRFLLLLYGDEAAESAMSPADRRAIMERHVEWARELRERGALVASEALGTSREAAVIHGGHVSDGPFAETKEQLGGFYLLDCPTRSDAIAWARQAPQSPGLVVEVRPIADM